MTIGNASISYVDTKTALQDVTPTFTSSGNMSVATSTTGTTFVNFASQACNQLTIANNTGVVIEFNQDSSGPTFPIYPSTYYTIFGISNASEIGIRRVDNSTTSVNVVARWGT